MPRACSTDLRERVLVSVEAGESPEDVAERFMVGRASVYRWVAAARDEGRRAPKPMNGGPKPAIRDQTEEALRRLVEENNHLTLAEYRDRLAAATGVRVGPDGTVDGGAEDLAGDDAAPPLQAQRTGGCHPLHAIALGRSDADPA
jgi:transposase